MEMVDVKRSLKSRCIEVHIYNVDYDVPFENQEIEKAKPIELDFETIGDTSNPATIFKQIPPTFRIPLVLPNKVHENIVNNAIKLLEILTNKNVILQNRDERE